MPLDGVGAGREAGGKPLEEAARAFESIFVQTLLKSMRSTIKKNELFDGGRGEEIFTGMMDQQFADAAAGRGGGIGLAKMIVAQYGKHARAAEETGATLDLRAREGGIR